MNLMWEKIQKKFNMPTYQIQLCNQEHNEMLFPIVNQLAVQMNLTGTYSKVLNGVDIIISGAKKNCLQYYTALIDVLPSETHTTDYCMKGISERAFNDFSILNEI